MNKRKRHLIGLIVLIGLFLVGCQKEKSVEGEPFRVGMEADYAPFNWTQNNPDNNAAKIKGAKEFAGGYDILIAQKIADKLGRPLEIVKTEWDGLIPALTSDKVDVIIAGMSPNAERKASIDFSDNYYTSNLVMVIRDDSKYKDAKSIQDFKGAKITGQLNTFHYSVIDQINGVSKETAMDNFAAMRVALEAGMIDGYVSEMPEGISATNAIDKFAMVEFEDGFKTDSEDTSIAVGLPKNSDLTKEVNDILAGIPESERNTMMELAIKTQPGGSHNRTSLEWVEAIVKDNWKVFVRGAGVTLLISLLATVIGSFIGLLIGMIRTLPKPKKRGQRYLLKFVEVLLSIYIEIFRGTPMIVQSMVIYYGSALAFGIQMNPIGAAIFIVSVNTGAYMSEIVRGGIFSIDEGQFEAAHAIGMNHFQTMTNVVLPQVVRNILPATGNEFVINIKDTSVLNVIAVTELYFQTKSIAGNNFRYFEAFFVASVIYFVMTFTVTRILRWLEKKFDGPDNYLLYANQMQVSEPLDDRE